MQNEELHKAQAEIEESQSKYVGLYDFAPVGYFTLNSRGMIIEANLTAATLLGVARNVLLRKPFFRFVLPEFRGLFHSHFEKSLSTDMKQTCELKLTRKTGLPFHASLESVAMTDGDGNFSQCLTTVSDITERKHAEEIVRNAHDELETQVRERTKELRREEEELRRLNRTLKALGKSSKAMMRARNESEYLKDVCRIIVEDCGHAMVWIGFAEDDDAKTVRPVAYAGFEEGYIETLKITWADTERGRGPTGTAIRTGQPSICRNMQTDPLFKPWREEAIKRGYASSVVVPLMDGGKAIGAMNIYAREPDPFTEDEVNLLSELAGDLSYGISSIRLKVAHDRTEEAIRQSEERYRSLVEVSPDALFVNRDNRIVFANPAALQLFGATGAEQVLGKSPFEMFEPGYHPIMRKRIETLLGGESVPLIESRIVRLDGTIRDVEVAAAPFDDSAGRAIQVILRDITERKQMEGKLRRAKDDLEIRVQERTLELKKSEHKYRMLIEQAADGIVLLDRELNLVDVNTTACKMTGFTREELLKLNARDLYQPGELEERPLRLNEVLAGETVITERRATKKDGSPIEVEISAKLIEGGQIQAIVRDITERKVEERRTHLITELLELFAKKTSRKEYLDSVVQLIHDWTDCRSVGIRVVNEERYLPYESYVGFSPEFMKMENMISLDSDACACIRAISEQFEPQDSSAITSYGSFRLDNSIEFAEQLTEKELARFRGNCIRSGYASIDITPIRYHNQPLGAIHLADEREGMVPLNTIQFLESMAAPLIGEAIYRFSAEEELIKHRHHLEDIVKERTAQLETTNEELGREITVRKHAEEELKQLTDELKRSNADLRQFAYAASHDLQEPLRVVAGFVKLLEKRYKEKLDEKAHEYIDYTVDGVKRMQMLIKDLLEFSQVGTKGKTFSPTNCSVALEQAIYNLHFAIEESGAEVTYDILPTVMGDSSQLTSLFQNLIGNAMKFQGKEKPKIHICSRTKGKRVGIHRPGQRHRDRSEIRRADIRHLPAPPHQGRIRRHRHGAFDMQKNRRAPRRTHLGRIGGWEGLNVFLHDTFQGITTAKTSLLLI